ncbi:hypothetical protein DFH08DRAFT_1034062 [Mycena albidolilacea]|uniref:Uncharacterized protein n=1 Tax=Mycena albidolilacea TaxID=1033008 RepID=A0AAD6ZFW4_9AGAR|nr:hypothetical protein DFH08DRAFT_1034062 [Mycena albidolilacea]
MPHTAEPPASAPSDPSLAPLVAAVNELVVLISRAAARYRWDGSTAPVERQQPSRITPHLDSLPPSSRLALCSYCDSPAHFIARCPRVAEDVATGLCRRNSEGKVVLPSGSFVPRRIVGPNLRARIISWHAANPARSVPDFPTSCSCPSVCAPAASHVPVPCAPESTSPFTALSPHLPRLNPSPRHIPEPTFAIEDRISTLQSQLAALCSRARSHVVTDVHVVLSPSAPSQPVLHRPHPSLHPETAVFVQQWYNNQQSCTYTSHVAPASPSTSYRVPASQSAPASSVDPAIPGDEPSQLQSVYMFSQQRHVVPRAFPLTIPHIPAAAPSRIDPPRVTAYPTLYRVIPSCVLAPVTLDTAVPSHVVADHPHFESPAAQTLQYCPESPQPHPEPVQRSTRLLRSSETYMAVASPQNHSSRMPSRSASPSASVSPHLSPESTYSTYESSFRAPDAATMPRNFAWRSRDVYAKIGASLTMICIQDAHATYWLDFPF